MHVSEYDIWWFNFQFLLFCSACVETLRNKTKLHGTPIPAACCSYTILSYGARVQSTVEAWYSCYFRPAFSLAFDFAFSSTLSILPAAANSLSYHVQKIMQFRTSSTGETYRPTNGRARGYKLLLTVVTQPKYWLPLPVTFAGFEFWQTPYFFCMVLIINSFNLFFFALQIKCSMCGRK